ncbi:MAG: tetratricopeptide repeat protein [Anaerolineae bacterium]|nr:tetratricopeptide repeat protein [Anaerolineae bacterium]
MEATTTDEVLLSQGKIESVANAFNEQLAQALSRFGDPVWLGECSPLAAPYFLGQYLLDRAESGAGAVVARGQALQKLLRDTAAELEEQDRQVLDLSFFQHRRKSSLAIEDELHISRATYYRYRKQAVQHLEETLVRRLNPALRLEIPPACSQLIGRDDVVKACLEALRAGQTVALTGPSGVGKTTLGAYLSRCLAPRPVFWFTLRPGLNDRLSSLLFALGYALHRQGASGAWLQLVADEGQVNPEVTLGLIRHDLQGLNGSSPLLCFDEIDLLHPAEVEAHAQILAFLRGMQGLAPMLFIGQELPIEAQHYYSLEGLAAPAVRQMLAEASIHLAIQDVERVQMYTQGTPRLLEMFITLHRSGEPLAEALERLSGSPSVESLLSRVWRRLSAGEQGLLMALAVFRRPAPGDAWPTSLEQSTLNRLVERRLVQWDGHGGVMLLPAFRKVIYARLPAEDKEALHLEAATIRAERGEYTAAVYHFLLGGQPGVAIHVWYPHRTQEINQGQAGAALALFDQVSHNQLNADDARTLVLLRGELRVLAGRYDEIREDLRSISWPASHVATARARRLEGHTLELQSRYDEAARAYREGLETVERLLEGEAAEFHRNLGWTYMRQKDLEQAWREALLARYEVENLQGYLQEERGNYAQAQAHYIAALALATELGHTEGKAKTHDHLAALLARQARFDEAETHLQKAHQYYERIGRKNRLAGLGVNWAYLCNLAGRYREALEPAAIALDAFAALGDSWGMAVAAQNLAEAHLGLGNLEAAAHFAQQVVQEEETGTLPDGLRVLGEVKLAQGALPEAEKLVRQSIQVAEQNQDRFLSAYGWRALGQVYLAQGDAQNAKTALEKAQALFEALELPQEVARTRMVFDEF